MFLGSVSSQQRFGVMDIKTLSVSQLSGLGHTVFQLSGLQWSMLQLFDKLVLQLHVTALFYLDNSRKIHLQGMRACRLKDAKRRVPQYVGDRERERKRERESEPFGSSFYIFFLPPGPALCKLGLTRSAVLPEVLTPVLGPSFDLPLFYFRGLFPSLSFSHRHLDSCFLSYLPNNCVATIHTFTSVLTLKDLYRKEYLAVLPIQNLIHLMMTYLLQDK